MTNLMFEDFKMYYPLEGRRTLKYWENCTYELCVKLDDGEIFIFDYINKTIRRAPVYGEQLTEEECKNEFGRRLQRLLYSKGMTQEDLAEMTGISQKILSQYITGRVCPSFTKVDRICKALGCSMDKLRYMDREGN